MANIPRATSATLPSAPTEWVATAVSTTSVTPPIVIDELGIIEDLHLFL
jgi:hypothetical protein